MSHRARKFNYYKNNMQRNAHAHIGILIIKEFTIINRQMSD